MTYLDAEAVIKAQALLRAYENARAENRLDDASRCLSQTIMALENAQSHLWNEMAARANA